MVIHGDEVYEEGGATDERGHEKCPSDHLPYPNFASHSGVKATAKVTIDGAGGSVHEY